MKLINIPNCLFCNALTLSTTNTIFCSSENIKGRSHELNIGINDGCFYLWDLKKDFKIGKDKAGYYIMFHDKFIDIKPFELKNIMNRYNHYIGLYGFA